MTTTTNFDQKLAQKILKKYLEQSKSERSEKFQRQSTGPFVSPSIREVRREVR